MTVRLRRETRVDDLTTAWIVRPGLGPTPLLGPEPDLAEVASAAIGDPILRRRLISSEGKAALVVAHVEEGRESFEALTLPVRPAVAFLR